MGWEWDSLCIKHTVAPLACRGCGWCEVSSAIITLLLALSPWDAGCQLTLGASPPRGLRYTMWHLQTLRSRFRVTGHARMPCGKGAWRDEGFIPRVLVGEFPGSSVLRTQCFHCHGPKFNPWLGNRKILQAVAKKRSTYWGRTMCQALGYGPRKSYWTLLIWREIQTFGYDTE